MRCKYCYNEIPDNSEVCNYCNQTLIIKTEQIQNTQLQNNQSQNNPELIETIKSEDITMSDEPAKNSQISQNKEGIEKSADIESRENAPPENKPPEKKITLKNKAFIVFCILCACNILMIFVLIFINIYHNNKSIYVSNTTSNQLSDNTDIVKLRFKSLKFNLDLGENKKLPLSVYPIEAENQELIWESSDETQIKVDNSGMVTALEEGGSATITVKDKKSGNVSASCEVNVYTKEKTFFNTVNFINTNKVYMESINVYEENYNPNKRDNSLEWDDSLFYRLEDIYSDKDDDGQINFYTVEKKQLLNEVTENIMEYEIYRNPDNKEVNKIVSIEYRNDNLEIVDYYFSEGKINFIFMRTDSSYTPTYASRDKMGQRFYFNNDVLLKWREIYVPLQVDDYTISPAENSNYYNDLSNDKKNAYDEAEIKMINAAYNTYNNVLQAKSIGFIRGYITDVNNNGFSGVSAKVFSNDYKTLVSECLTDENGYYNLPVPSNSGSYFVRLSKPGYVTTDIYDVEVNNQFLTAYQENIYMLKDIGASYDVYILLCDAFSKVQDVYYENNNDYGTFHEYNENYEFDEIEGNLEGYYNGDYNSNEYMWQNNALSRLSNAVLNIRKGVNNKSGTIFKKVTANEYGEVIVNLPAGTYTGEIIKSGYVTSYFTIVAKSDYEHIQGTTTPILGENEVRIVLTWGDKPRDLDSHLFTPYQGDAGDMQHIGYYNTYDSYGNNLDVDIVDGYGPETTAITNLGTGLYKFYVADFTNCIRDNINSTEMSASSAKVNVYTKNGLVQTFNVPQNKSGVIWEVFEIRNKKITPIQRYYNNISDKPWWSSSKFD